MQYDWEDETRYIIAALLTLIPVAFLIDESPKDAGGFLNVLIMYIGIVLMFAIPFAVAYLATNFKVVGVVVCAIAFFALSALYMPKLNPNDELAECRKQIADYEAQIARYEDAEEYYKMVCDEYGVDVYK